MIILDSLSRPPKRTGSWRGGERGRLQSIFPNVGGLTGHLDLPLSSCTAMCGHVRLSSPLTTHFGASKDMGRAQSSPFSEVGVCTHVVHLFRGTEKSKGGCRKSKKLLTGPTKTGLGILSLRLYYISLFQLFQTII